MKNVRINAGCPHPQPLSPGRGAGGEGIRH
jgi:hypothetical protein